jgi:DNA-binding FrmR family transcriptional regulator
MKEEELEVIKRLINVQGQIKGLIKMIGEERDIIEIINVIKASRSALDRAGEKYILSHLFKDLTKRKSPSRKDKYIKKLLSEISRFS